MSSLASRARVVCWLAWGALLAQQAADAVLRDMHPGSWVIKLLPLLLFVPGMMRDRLRSFIWLCFVCLLYFMALVERLFAQPDSALAAVGMTAVVLLFTSAMLYVRWRARELRAAAEGNESR